MARVKVYVLLQRRPGSGGGFELAALLSALASAAPSRMAPIGEGLSSLRNAPIFEVYLARYEEMRLPNILATAKLLVDRALIEETFSMRSQTDTNVFSMARIERLFYTHSVGVDEPSAASALNFEIRRSTYRDTLLHPLTSLLFRLFSEEASFLRALDQLEAEISSR